MGWRVAGEGGATDDPYRFLVACLPEAYGKAEVLDKLTPQTFRRLLETAGDLTFGLGWRRKTVTAGSGAGTAGRRREVTVPGAGSPTRCSTSQYFRVELALEASVRATSSTVCAASSK